MSIKAMATIVLAAGIAAAKPINAPRSLSGSTKRQIGFNSVVNGFNGNDNDFNFIDGFNNFNQQQQVIQIQEENLQIVDNGRQQAVVQQVQEVLIVDQVNNGFNNDLNNLFRKSNFQNKFRDVSTVTLVVQEIQVAIDDGRGNQVQQNIFAQSAVVANRGARETQTVMVFDSRTLIAQDILGNDAFANLGGFDGIAGATAALDDKMPTKTAGIQLFGAKPTWTAVAEDPAATLGAIWQGALQDLQNADNDEEDNKLNEQIAAEELKAIQELLGQQDDADKQDDEEQKKADKEEQKEQEQKEEEQKEQEQKEEEQKEEEQKEEEQKEQEQKEEEKKEEEKKEEEQKKAEEEQKEDEQKKAEEEADKQDAEEQKKAYEEAKKAEEEQQKKKADEEAKAQAEQDKKAAEEQKKAEA